MTSKRSIHVQKSREEVTTYRKNLESIDYKPTVSDDNIDFDPTTQTGENLPEKKYLRSRPRPVSSQILEHLRKNIVAYILGATALVAVYLVNESRVSNARNAYKIDEHTSTLSDISHAIENLTKQNHEQDIKIVKIGDSLIFIEKSFDETRKDVKEISNLLRPIGRNNKQ